MTVTGTRRPASSQTWVMPSFSPRTPLTVLSMVLVIAGSSELDLDVDVRRQIEAHQRVDRLGGRVDDVDEALVRPHLEVLAGVLVLVRRPDDDEHVLLRGQRHRADHRRTGTGHRVDNLARRVVDDLVVIRLQSDADLLSRHLRYVSLSPNSLHVAGSRTSDPRGRVCRTRSTVRRHAFPRGRAAVSDIRRS